MENNNDLDKGVVDDAGEDVDDVEDGEGHQQVVEGGSHLWLPGGGGGGNGGGGGG